MSSQPRPIFDSSFAAVVLMNARHRAGQVPTARTPRLSRGLGRGSSTVISIQFAPEPEPALNVLELGQDQTTGLLPLGFEFEFFGVRYTSFDLSSDGFLTFGTNSSPSCSDSRPRSRLIPISAALHSFITLGWTDVGPLGRRHIAYEVRGVAHRRRLVLSFARVPASPKIGFGAMTAQLVLHERTGMIDVHTTRRDVVAPDVTEEGVRFTTSPW